MTQKLKENYKHLDFVSVSTGTVSAVFLIHWRWAAEGD